MTKVRAKKKFGQNFLHATHVVDKIVDEAKSAQLGTWMEIGCGTGLVTKKLKELGCPFLGIELDSELVPILQEYFVDDNSTLLNESILEVSEDTVLQHLDKDYGIVGNLPYYITTPILEKILLQYQNWTTAIFMVQKEFADRMVAASGSRTFGRLSVFCQYYSSVKKVINVKRGCFRPIPGVDSAVIRLERKPLSLEPKAQGLMFSLVKAAFSQRRKKAFKLMTSRVPEEKLFNAFNVLGIDENSRAEQISTELWIKLARELA
jgi:16S rRNA (adenine1518-N6/adenine1519-N6)-dimethyltransferase